MKLVKNALSSARKAKSRRKYRGERGTLSDTFASFFNAMPMTPTDAAGHTAFHRTCMGAMEMMSPTRILAAGPDAPVFGDIPVVEVNADAPDNIVSALKNLSGERYCAWLNTGMDPDVFANAVSELSDCVALYLKLPGLQPKDQTSGAIKITEALMGVGFEPVLRSAEGQDGAFNLFLIHRAVLSEVADKLADEINAACDPTRNALPILNQDIPVLIPCFNNQTYCRAMIAQLHTYGFKNITLVDNASTNPEMHKFLDEAESLVTVERLADNLGPRNSVFTPERLAKLPRYFCVTDPDIRFNTFLPKDFLSQMVTQMQTYGVGKAGFALDISHRQFFKDTIVDLLYQKWTIWEWEERFWGDRVGQTPGNDAVYRALVDTTFAIYDNEVWTKDRFLDAVRVGGRFTAGHVPWYEESDVPAEERDTYFSESVYSFYKM